jgi:hypothetical protein
MKRLSLVAAAALLLALLNGCATITTSVAPANMHVSIDIKDYRQPTTQVAIHFADVNGNTIEFVHGETVTCNGTYLAYSSGYYASLFGYGAYEGNVTDQPANGAYTFTYTAPGQSPLTVTVPVVTGGAQFTQPTNNASVPIPTTAPLVVTFQSSGPSSASIAGVATDSRIHIVGSLALSDTGSISFKASDFANFVPGPGSISLSRITSSAPANPGFAELKVSYENITTISVSWTQAATSSS